MKYRVYDTKEHRYRDDVVVMPDGQLGITRTHDVIVCGMVEIASSIDDLFNSDGRFVVEMCSPWNDSLGISVYEGDIIEFGLSNQVFPMSYNDGVWSLATILNDDHCGPFFIACTVHDKEGE
jgi:hypothetical protein